MRLLRRTALALVAALGCAPSNGDPMCGMTALAGATMLLDQFNVPRQTLSEAPVSPPALLPVRIAAGPARRGLVSLGGNGWQVGVEGEIPAGTVPGFGVLVVDGNGSPRGVMLFGGLPVQGAPEIGRVRAGGLDLPLLGLRTDVAGLETAGCPFFPDSLRRP